MNSENCYTEKYEQDTSLHLKENESGIKNKCTLQYVCVLSLLLVFEQFICRQLQLSG